MNEVIKTIQSRRSIRAYRPDPLARAQLDAIVEAGIWAPSANNKQAWRFTVLAGRDILSRLNEKVREKLAASPEDWQKQMAADPGMDITYGAPALVIVSAEKGYGAGETDCAAALENMMLAAHGMGIASCWMGFLGFTLGSGDALRSFGVPEGYEMRQAAIFGYAADGAAPSAPARNMDVVNYVGELR